MQQYLQFFQNHLLLFAALIAALAAIIFEEFKGKIGAVTRLAPQEVTFLINREDAVVCDLRKQDIFLKGHILGAINLEKNALDANMKKLEPFKQKTIILVDETDSAVLAFASKLKKQGFEKINVLSGGMVAWNNSNLPLAKK